MLTLLNNAADDSYYGYGGTGYQAHEAFRHKARGADPYRGYSYCGGSSRYHAHPGDHDDDDFRDEFVYHRNAW